MSKLVRLLIPHTSQRGNFYPRGAYREDQLPPEILKSNSIKFEEERLVSEVIVDVSPVMDYKENILEVTKETRDQAEKKGLVEKQNIEERVEKLGIEKIENRTPLIEKVNHNPKEKQPDPVTNEYQAILNKEADKEITVKENKVSKKITRLL